ncbi:acyltransferase family protein [uncultured Fusobacterium sp.]|uniref:acyltransferase family protein n=1 Tax=uncultured Fusobacterium sp. TaxID=159267 RepID=UPI0025FF8204|nr:acyltransferase family protein [uncultured Fusobacterium sp.]
MKERYKELDLMKGIGIILVYIGHSFNFPNFRWTKILFFLGNTIYSFHMPLFFFISGLLSNTNNEINLEKFYKGKIKRLLIPYFFINLIDFIPRTLLPNLVNSEFGGIKEVLFYGTKISWFVYTLFIIFMIFPFLDTYILKKDRYYLFGIVLIIVNYLKIFENIEIFSFKIVVSYLLYFYIGYIIKPLYKEKIKNGIESKNLIFLITSIVFLSLSYKYFYLSYFNSVIFAILGILFVLNISLRIKEDTITYRVFNFLGINSLTFYLIEGFITVVYRVILLRIISIEYSYLLVSTFFILRVITAYVVVKLVVVKSSVLSFLLGASVEKK